MTGSGHDAGEGTTVMWRLIALALILVPILWTLLDRQETTRPDATVGGAGPAAKAMLRGATGRRAWFVMGTMAAASVWDLGEERASEALERARAVTLRIDSLMSSYIATSEISLLNRRAGTGIQTQIGSETEFVLSRALQIGRDSGGRFDVTVASLVELWRFYVPWRGEEVEPPSRAEIDSVRTRVGQRSIRLDRSLGTALLEDPGLRIDLGGIGKGYALDLAADEVRRAGVGRAYLELGGQIRLVGEEGAGEGWRLGIRHPRQPDRIVAILSVEGGSIATSGDYERYFMWEGRRYFHIIDPSTGWPAYGTASVTVWAPSALDADGWSTALFVAGAERGAELLAGLPGIGALWILDPGEGPLTDAHFRVAGPLIGRVELLGEGDGSPFD